MKLKEIESALQQVPNFTKPIITLEQYTTPAKLGSLVLHYMDLNGDIQGLELADLGCGCGIFTLGCYLLGSRKVLAVDIDQDALELCEKTLKKFISDQREKVTLINADVLTLLGDVKYESCVDVVVMNPPFGTKNNRGLDMKFLRVAAFMARSTRCTSHPLANT
ncbi:rRNA N6-adenosine-methyltransferase METTL5-like [Zophobas morio]|uniref:rRNA N6-adenosine-methyltransferase METTL5-like n=1 Tax=Zophobas morio TaxID=2755281 RepID=UPI00308331AD